MDRCSALNFPNDTIPNNTALKNLENWYCVNNTNLQVGGSWTTQLYDPKVSIKKCDSDTEKKYNITCAADLTELLETTKYLFFLN